MNSNQFRIKIDNTLTNESAKAELQYDGIKCAEIHSKDQELQLRVFSHPTKKCWEFAFQEVVDVIQKAKQMVLDETE